MRPAIGVSDFNKIVQKNPITGEIPFYFDKTLMIKDIIEDQSDFLLFTRPRRFGKTLNLDMLKSFFNKKSNFFDGLNISNYPEIIEKYQGKIPTISISLKGVIGPSYEIMCKLFVKSIKEAFLEFHEIVIMKEHKTLMKKDAWEFDEMSEIIRILCKDVYNHFHSPVIVLLDEYDSPVNNAYINGFLQEALELMKAFFSATFKENRFLYKGIITGISRIARESLFSGLNNVKICNIDKKQYSEYFGFTEGEISTLDLPDKNKNEIREWYNGYNFGGTTIYNPWSILNYIDNNFRAELYWSNTGGMTTIEENITLELTESLDILLKGEKILLRIEDSLIYGDLKDNPDAFLNMLYNAGYLTACSEFDEDNFRYLKIVNKEVLKYMQLIYLRWFTRRKEAAFLRDLIKYFVEGDSQGIEEILQYIVLSSLSFHDVTRRKQEAFYHGLVLGLSLAASDRYTIKSNREGGYGRYDIAWYPKNIAQDPGILIELKIDSCSPEEALKQIDVKKYEIDLMHHGCKQIIKYGMHCSGKEIKVVYK
jgi:hypothetical protein